MTDENEVMDEVSKEEPKIVSQRDLRRYTNAKAKAIKLQMEVDDALEKFKKEFLSKHLEAIEKLNTEEARLYQKIFFVLSKDSKAFEEGSRIPLIKTELVKGRSSTKWKEEYSRLFTETRGWIPIKEELDRLNKANKKPDTTKEELVVV